MHSATGSRWPWRERETGPEPPLKRHWRAPTAWLPVAVLVPWLPVAACQIVQAIKQPEGHGYSDVAGSVTVLERNRWLIAWGRQNDVTANLADVPSIVEVDPSTGTTYLELHLSKSGTLAWSYRVYRVPESQITIPLNLP